MSPALDSPVPRPYDLDLDLDGSGRPYVSGKRTNMSTGEQRGFVARFTTGGVRDAGWDGDGYADVNPGGTEDLYAVDAVEAGGAVAAGHADGDALVARLGAAGEADTSFNGTGMAVNSVGGTSTEHALGVAVDAVGRPVFTGYTDGPTLPYVAPADRCGRPRRGVRGNGRRSARGRPDAPPGDDARHRRRPRLRQHGSAGLHRRRHEHERHRGREADRHRRDRHLLRGVLGDPRGRAGQARLHELGDAARAHAGRSPVRVGLAQ